MPGPGAIKARTQTIDDIYGLLWIAVASKRPIEAYYAGHARLLCPYRLGRNKKGQLRVLCYQYGGRSESGLQPAGSPANWRCLALENLSKVSFREDAWRNAPNHSRPTSCIVAVDIDAEDQPEVLTQ